MTPKMLRLTDDDTELVLWRDRPLRRDVIVTKLDVSSPDVRAEVVDRPDDDGVDDDTALHGSAAVSLELKVFDLPQTLYAQIKPFLRIGRRPYLCLTDSEWGGERRIRLRADQWTAPLPWEGLGRWIDLQLQWKAPDGRWEGAETVTLSVLAQGASSGRTYPLMFPRIYPTTRGTGQIDHVNPGDVPAHQRARLYGPCNGPRYTNDTTGESIIFSESFSIPAGEYVEIDTKNRTAYYLSDPAASRLNFVDFAHSSWWRVPPGLSRVRYHPVSGVDRGCEAVAEYRAGWF